MEIPEIVLAQALEESLSTQPQDELVDMLRELEAKEISDFLNVGKDEQIIKADKAIYAKIQEVASNPGCSKAETIASLSQVIASARVYLHQAIYNPDLKAALIFLSLNCYLKIDFSRLFQKGELPEPVTLPLADKIIQVLSTFRFETSAHPGAPYNELKLLQDAQDAFTQDEISGTYDLILRLERGGRGFHFNFLLENLLDFLFQLNYTFFIKALSVLNHPHAIVFYLQGFSLGKLIRLAPESTLENRWLNFELIRQILEKKQNEEFGMIEQEGVQFALFRITGSDFGFLKQTVKFFHASPLFNAALGNVLASLDEVQIKEVMIESFPVEEYHNRLEARNQLLMHFGQQATSEKQALLLRCVYNRWELFMEEKSRSPEFYLNKVMLTDFGDFIVQFFSTAIPTSELIKQAEILLYKIKYLDSEWVTSKSNQTTKFFLHFSRLYLISFAFKKNSLDPSALKSLIRKVKEDTIAYNRYLSRNSATSFQIVLENFS